MEDTIVPSAGVTGWLIVAAFLAHVAAFGIIVRFARARTKKLLVVVLCVAPSVLASALMIAISGGVEAIVELISMVVAFSCLWLMLRLPDWFGSVVRKCVPPDESAWLRRRRRR